MTDSTSSPSMDTAAASRILAAVWTLAHDSRGNLQTDPFTARDILDEADESVSRRNVHDRLDDWVDLNILERADTDNCKRWRPVKQEV